MTCQPANSKGQRADSRKSKFLTKYVWSWHDRKFFRLCADHGWGTVRLLTTLPYSGATVQPLHIRNNNPMTSIIFATRMLICQSALPSSLTAAPASLVKNPLKLVVAADIPQSPKLNILLSSNVSSWAGEIRHFYLSGPWETLLIEKADRQTEALKTTWYDVLNECLLGHDQGDQMK